MSRFFNSLRRTRKFRLFDSRTIVSFVLALSVIAVGGNYIQENNATKISKDSPSWSWLLGGITITIDAGHGGVDPGAIGVNKTLEKDVNLEVAKRVQALFTQAGSNVVMLREDDRDFGQSSKLLQRKREDLSYRAQRAIETNAKVYLSIHANSFSDPRQHGAQVFYHASSPEGKILAERVQESLNLVSPRKREAKSNQSYFILKNTDMLALTIEVGFLSNPEEEKNLNKSEYQEKLAMAIFEGVANYFAKDIPINK